MESFFIIILCFILALTTHILVHRYIRATFKNVILSYALGGLFLYGFYQNGLITLPLSGTLLYILLSALAILFYVSISLGTELPSSIILRSFKRKKKQKLSDLTVLFTDRGLIVKRIDDLIQSTLITRSGGSLKLTGRGKIVWNVIEAYRRVFHRRHTE